MVNRGRTGMGSLGRTWLGPTGKPGSYSRGKSLCAMPISMPDTFFGTSEAAGRSTTGNTLGCENQGVLGNLCSDCCKHCFHLSKMKCLFRVQKYRVFMYAV